MYELPDIALIRYYIAIVQVQNTRILVNDYDLLHKIQTNIDNYEIYLKKNVSFVRLVHKARVLFKVVIE